MAALGHSKLLFKWSIYKWSFLLGTVFVGMNFGVVGIVWGVVLSNANTYMVNAVLASRKLDQSIWLQIGQIGRVLGCVLLSMLVAYSFKLTIMENGVLTGLVFVIVYVMSSWMLNRNYVSIVFEMVRFLKK